MKVLTPVFNLSFIHRFSLTIFFLSPTLWPSLDYCTHGVTAIIKENRLNILNSNSGQSCSSLYILGLEKA